MHFSREELELIYNCVPDGDLKNKIGAQLFVNDDLVEDIKKAFPDVASIWKSCNANSYYAKFYDSEDEDTPFRIGISIEIENKYGPSTEVHVLELNIKDKGTTNDWMYSDCDLIWEKPN